MICQISIVNWLDIGSQISLIFLQEDKERDKPSRESTPDTKATTAPSSIASHNSEKSQSQGSPKEETNELIVYRFSLCIQVSFAGVVFASIPKMMLPPPPPHPPDPPVEEKGESKLVKQKDSH